LPSSIRLLNVDTLDACISLFGTNDLNVALIEQETGVSVALRGAELLITGDDEAVMIVDKVVSKLLMWVEKGETIDRTRIRYLLHLARNGQIEKLDDSFSDVVAITNKGKQIKCKTLGQREYVKAIKENDLTFAVGPAGTGKTYLAMALAVAALRGKDAEKIVLTRPAVEAGERLGFLPGDLTQKVDPYLRPLYDALYEFIGLDGYQKLMERGAVEVAPLAYMRGRTLSNSFIILDEAQNTTSEQMKMFLTRLGAHSKIVVTGDITQTDLPPGKKSGLLEALHVLEGVKGISMIFLTDKDVVRHELVQAIVNAYDVYETRGKGKSDHDTSQA